MGSSGFEKDLTNFDLGCSGVTHTSAFFTIFGGTDFSPFCSTVWNSCITLHFTLNLIHISIRVEIGICLFYFFSQLYLKLSYINILLYT